MIIGYKNSILATLVSIIGCAFVFGGIAMVIEDGWSDSETMSIAIIMIVSGLALAFLGKYISNNKAFKKWWKQIEENNLEADIAQNLNTAIIVYQKNPQRRTIKKIATLNPAFAEYIEKNTSKNNK